jgi:hypothetical protein
MFSALAKLHSYAYEVYCGTKPCSMMLGFQKSKWIRNLNVQHIHEYIQLCVQLNDFHLNEEADDYISWNLTPNGEYSMASTYNAQFFGATNTPINKLVWKSWSPSKVKFFTWLPFHSRIWTADYLERRRWNNCWLVRFTSKPKRYQLTSSPIVATPRGVGIW